MILSLKQGNIYFLRGFNTTLLGKCHNSVIFTNFDAGRFYWVVDKKQTFCILGNVSYARCDIGYSDVGGRIIVGDLCTIKNRSKTSQCCYQQKPSPIFITDINQALISNQNKKNPSDKSRIYRLYRHPGKASDLNNFWKNGQINIYDFLINNFIKN